MVDILGGILPVQDQVVQVKWRYLVDLFGIEMLGVVQCGTYHVGVYWSASCCWAQLAHASSSSCCRFVLFTRLQIPLDSDCTSSPSTTLNCVDWFIHVTCVKCLNCELRKVLFLAPSVCRFLFVYDISREPLNGFAPNSQGTRVWSLARTSLKVNVKGQGHQGQKRQFWHFRQPACGLRLAKQL